jgi:hypothetical protein
LSLPWNVGDILRAIGLATLGLAALVAATIKSSGEHALADQVVWLNLAVGGVLLCGVGVAVFLLNGRRAIGVGRQALALRLDVGDPVVRPSVLAPIVTGSGDLVAAPGTTHFHHDGCLLIRGKSVQRASVEEHRAGGRTACPMCAPGPTG